MWPGTHKIAPSVVSAWCHERIAPYRPPYGADIVRMHPFRPQMRSRRCLPAPNTRPMLEPTAPRAQPHQRGFVRVDRIEASLHIIARGAAPARDDMRYPLETGPARGVSGGEPKLTVDIEPPPCLGGARPSRRGLGPCPQYADAGRPVELVSGKSAGNRSRARRRRPHGAAQPGSPNQQLRADAMRDGSLRASTSRRSRHVGDMRARKSLCRASAIIATGVEDRCGHLVAATTSDDDAGRGREQCPRDDIAVMITAWRAGCGRPPSPQPHLRDQIDRSVAPPHEDDLVRAARTDMNCATRPPRGIIG